MPEMGNAGFSSGIFCSGWNFTDEKTAIGNGILGVTDDGRLSTDRLLRTMRR